MSTAGVRLSVVACMTAMFLLALGNPARAVDDPTPVDIAAHGRPLLLPNPPRSPEALARLSDGDLYLHTVDLGQELMACVNPVVERAGVPQMAKRLHDARRYPALVDAAAGVLGSRNPTSQAARAGGEGSEQGVMNLIAGLGRFAMDQRSEIMRQRLLRAKAIYILGLELAGVSDGACAPSPGLAAALARVPPEH